MNPPRLTQISWACGRQQVLDQRSGLGGVVEHPEQVAAAGDAARELRVDVGEREEAVVLRLGAGLIREERRDEARLVVQEAAWRLGEHRVGRLAEGGRHDGVRAAVAVGDRITERLPGLLDGRVGPLGLAGGPAVVHGRAGLAKDDVLDPVGSRPARVTAGLDAEAPLLLVAGHLRASVGVELVPGGGVRGPALPVRRVVPDEALHGALGEDAGELAIGRLADGGEALRGRRLVSRVVDEVERLERSVRIPRRHQAGTRADRRRPAACHRRCPP